MYAIPLAQASSAPQNASRRAGVSGEQRIVENHTLACQVVSQRAPDRGCEDHE
jgi:hypothetical protein